MKQFKNIIQSQTEPDKNSIWLSPQGLKKFSKKGWELIGGSTGGGGSNDYILPFTTDGNIDSKYFDEIKEAINSGKTIKHKNSNGSYRTIDYTIVKDEYIYCFIGNFDENTQIIDITKSGYAFEYNICSISGLTGQTIYINGDTPTQPALQSGYFNSGYTFYDNKLFGYRLNIFDIFTGECKIEDGIYTIKFERESNGTHIILGRCIIYSDSNNEKRITIVNEQEARDISIPGFVYAKGLVEGIEYEERPTNYGDIFYINLRDYRYGPGYKNNFGISYPEERTSILLNSKLVSFTTYYNSCIYKNNTIDQLANELSYNKELIKGIAEINYLVNLDEYNTTDELNSWYTKYRNGIKLRFYYNNMYYDIYKATDYRNYYAILDVKTHINFRWLNDGDDNWRLQFMTETIPEVTTSSSGLMPPSLYNKFENINNKGDGTKYLSDDGSYNTINDILIIDYSDITEQLPSKYPDITNKPLYITGLWDYTPDNGSLTKRFIPAIYTYNGSGSFTINYKVDISGPYEKKQIVGMIYYNGADKINHTYHTVCPSYTINLNVQEGTQTGLTFTNHEQVYNDIRQTVIDGGQIVIKGTVTTNYVEADVRSADTVVLRYCVPRIDTDNTVQLSSYEININSTNYSTKAIHKTLS